MCPWRSRTIALEAVDPNRGQWSQCYFLRQHCYRLAGKSSPSGMLVESVSAVVSTEPRRPGQEPQLHCVTWRTSPSLSCRRSPEWSELRQSRSTTTRPLPALYFPPPHVTKRRHFFKCFSCHRDAKHVLLGASTWDCVRELSSSNCRKVMLGNQGAKPNKGRKMNLQESLNPKESKSVLLSK